MLAKKIHFFYHLFAYNEDENKVWTFTYTKRQYNTKFRLCTIDTHHNIIMEGWKRNRDNIIISIEKGNPAQSIRDFASEKNIFFIIFFHIIKIKNKIGTFTYTTPKDNITPNSDCVLLTTITTNHNNGRLKGQSTD